MSIILVNTGEYVALMASARATFHGKERLAVSVHFSDTCNPNNWDEHFKNLMQKANIVECIL